MKNIKSIILLMLMALIALPASALDFEYQGLLYTVLDEDLLTCKTKNGFPTESFNNVAGDIVIPPTVTYDNKIYSVIEIGEYGFIRCDELISITLPETIKTIRTQAFAECSNMTSITLPQEVENIEYAAFSGCSSLTSINLPNGITTINNLFGGCTALTSIVIPETVTSINSESFFGCNSLTSITLSEGLAQIGNRAFYGCSSLESVIIPESVISIGEEAFNYCNSLTSINIPDGVTTIEYMTFNGCANLTSINIPDGVTAINGSAFSGCSSLTSITLPAGIESFGYYAFGSCTGLTNIENLASTPIPTHETVFSGLYDNVILEMPNANLADIQTTIPWKSFKHIIASDGSVGMDPPGEDFEFDGIIYTVINEDAKTCRTKEGRFENDFIPGNSVSTDVNIPEKVIFEGNEYTVVEIGDYGFVYGKMTSFSMPNTVTKIGKYAFGNCKNLTNLKLSESLEYIGEQAFQDCQSLSSLILPESLKTLEALAFNYCNHLESVEIPASITFFGNNVFFSCTSILSVKYAASIPVASNEYMFSSYNDATLYMPNAKLEDIEATLPWCKFRRIVASDGSIVPDLVEGDNFEYEGIWYTVTDVATRKCMTRSGRKVGVGEPGNKVDGDIIIPNVVSDGKFDYTVTTIGDYSFCTTDITSISLPESVTLIGEMAFLLCSKLNTITFGNSMEIIGQYAFSNCTDLKAITLPESLTSLGYGAFTLCKSLTSVSVPESITELNPYVFSHCENLVSVSLPQTLTIIGGYSFEYCTNLESIEIPNNVKLIDSYAFQGYNKITSIILPASLYKIENAAFIGCNKLESVEYFASEPISANSSVFHDTAYANATLRTPNATLTDVQATTPWNLFKRIIASDGSTSPALSAGDDFEYNGIWYTVIDSEDKTCMTKDGDYNNGDKIAGNNVSGDIVIPSVAYDGSVGYTVVEIGDYGFYNNTELTSISIPETVKAIEIDAFEYCSNLAKTNFASIEALCNIGFRSSSSNPLYLSHHLYIGNEEVTEVVIPESVKSIKFSTFLGASNLTTVIFHEGITSIGTSAFRGCSKLMSLDLPSSLTTIESSAFEDCDAVESVNLPDGIKTIEERAFLYCKSLTSITIPAGITSIGSAAFYECIGLSSVTYGAVTPIACDDNVFSTYYETVYANATLNMPIATLADVQATTPWNLFKKIKAKDGSTGFVNAGDNFEYDGIWYTVTDANTCMTRPSMEDFFGNVASGDLVIPEIVSDGVNEFAVTEIGELSFRRNPNLLSISLPSTIETVGDNAFSGCERLTSLIWRGNGYMSDGVMESIANPNILVYVEDAQLVPASLDHNVVADGVCERLVLTPGYPFTPVSEFTAKSSSFTKEFLQTTAFDGCAGWETIVLPFDVTRVVGPDGKAVTAFDAVTDVNRQRPYWLYEADPAGEWKSASAITAGVPYIISMPNNPRYNPAYNIHGAVTFSNPNPQLISTNVTAPYVTTWASGHEFRSLWLPLEDSEKATAMGLNVGMDNLTDDNGTLLAPGSAFHAGVTPKPLEAYVVSNGNARAFKIWGSQSAVLMLPDEDGLKISQDGGILTLQSSIDRTVGIFSADGTLLRRVELKASEPIYVEGLPQGVCLIAGSKLMIR